MAKVTRTKYNSKKWDKLYGENRPIMEPPKVKHSVEKKLYFSALEEKYSNNFLKKSFK